MFSFFLLRLLSESLLPLWSNMRNTECVCTFCIFILSYLSFVICTFRTISPREKWYSPLYHFLRKWTGSLRGGGRETGGCGKETKKTDFFAFGNLVLFAQAGIAKNSIFAKTQPDLPCVFAEHFCFEKRGLKRGLCQSMSYYLPSKYLKVDFRVWMYFWNWLLSYEKRWQNPPKC